MKKSKSLKLEEIAIRRVVDRVFVEQSKLAIPVEYNDVDIIYDGMAYEIVSGENSHELMKLSIANKIGNFQLLDKNLNSIYSQLEERLITVYGYEEIMVDSFNAFLGKIKQLMNRSKTYSKLGLVISFTEYRLVRDLFDKKPHFKFMQKYLTTRELCPQIIFLFENATIFYDLNKSNNWIKIVSHS